MTFAGTKAAASGWARRAALLAALGAAGAAPLPARAGDVAGTAVLEGPPPDLPPHTAHKDQSTCGALVPDESVAVGRGGGLANVVVTLAGPPPGAPVKATLDQRGCRFLPRVQAVPAGSSLEVRNGDPILHTAHGWRGRATQFDVPTPTKDAALPAQLGKPGLLQVRCDVHGWMRAFIVVADGPAAVTGPDGSFTLRDVPPGTYAARAWHEALGERTAQVVVTEAGAAALRFTFSR